MAISYPLHPRIEQHDVCVVFPSPVAGMEKLGNQWVTSGEFKSVAVDSKVRRNVVMEIDGLGWWAAKRPFISGLKAIKPSMSMRGNEFKSSLTPQLIEFQGAISAPFCHATSKTATFAPNALVRGRIQDHLVLICIL